jgi:agmatine deiminase
MTWPAADYMLDGSHAPRESVWRAWATVANTIREFQPVTVLVDPAHRDSARKHLSAGVEQLVTPVDDAWMRDSGPSFVVAAESGRLTAVSWEFNAWGGLDLAGTRADNEVAARVAAAAGTDLLRSSMVNEGGGIHVDGAGTVLVTETVQLDPRRNPGWTRADVERELARTIGAETAIWVERGLHRDYGPLGTRGHIGAAARAAGSRTPRSPSLPCAAQPVLAGAGCAGPPADRDRPAGPAHAARPRGLGRLRLRESHPRERRGHRVHLRGSG